MLSKEQLHWVASRIRWIYGRAYGEETARGLSDKQLEEIVGAVDKSRYRIAKPRLYRSWCGGMIQICGDGSQCAVLLGLHDRT